MVRNIPMVLVVLQIISQMAQVILGQGPFSYGARMSHNSSYAPEAPPHAFPFLGVVVWYQENQWIVTGMNVIILSEYVVMTTAFVDWEVTNLRVLVGLYNASEVEPSQQIRDVCYKESFLGGYAFGPRYVDILYLSEPLTFTEYVSSISIDEVPRGRPVPKGTKCTVVSFGVDIQTKDKSINVARYMAVTHRYCEDTEDYFLCPLEPALWAICTDSAAPLLCPYEGQIVLLGISVGNCAPPPFFAIGEMDKTAIAHAVNKGREICGGY